MDGLTDPAKLKALAAYNAASDHFDDEPLAFWARIGSHTVERLALPSGAMVLDVGCGSGASAIPAAMAVGPTGHVVGVDLADQLLHRAREKARQRSLSNVEFRQADMEELGYPDGNFEAVVSVFSVFFVPDMTKQVAELGVPRIRAGCRYFLGRGEEIRAPRFALRWVQSLGSRHHGRGST